MLYYYCIALIIIAGIIGGGYFISVSGVLSCILIGILICTIIKKNKIKIACDINLMAFFVLVLAYFLTALWGIDTGMSLVGGVKFFPLLLFFLVISCLEEEKNKIILLLPTLGTVMTIFSFLMMQFPSLKKYGTVSGRLAGFFQYPNTYALFMLICVILVRYYLKDNLKDWLYVGYMVIDIVGILMSKSRAVTGIFFLVVIFWVIKTKNKKLISLFLISCILIVLMLCRIGINDNLSTFWGRLLYANDALKIIISHPFGMGYYGYYFVQSEYQTGVYSVVNVHNELLQLMLDIGVIPAVLFYTAIFKSIVSKASSERDKLVLIVIAAHSLFDYDFQFLIIGFITILFLKVSNVKEVSISALTKGISVITATGILIVSFKIGVADYFYLRGEPEKSIKYYKSMTMSQIELLQETDSVEKMNKIATNIIEHNTYVPVAYSAKAQVMFAQGNMEEYLKYKLNAIKLAPYQYDEYEDYLKTLAYAEGEYVNNGDRKSAESCVNRAKAIPDMLEKVREKTSWLGWKINDIPQVKLSYENLQLIEEMEKKINE